MVRIREYLRVAGSNHLRESHYKRALKLHIAMAKINEVAVIEKRAHPLVVKAESFAIKTADDMKEATSLLSDLNKIGDSIQAEKDKVMKPLNQAIKAERARWKPIETLFDSGISALRRTMGAYQNEAKRIADEKKDKIAARVGDGKGKLRAETALAQMDEVKRPDQTVSTDEGTVKFRTAKKFEVMDITLLPIEYHLANEVAIKQQMQAGIELPGVRYYEEQVPVNFR